MVFNQILLLARWVKKYGNFDNEYAVSLVIDKTPEQRILELEQKAKLLEKQKQQAKHHARVADKRLYFLI